MWRGGYFAGRVAVNPTILLVHRDQILFESVKFGLERRGYSVHEASLETCCSMIDQVRPRVAILTFYEQSNEFFDVIHLISGKAVVIVSSGYLLEDFGPKSLQAGASKCVPKSSGPQGLLDAIEELVG